MANRTIAYHQMYQNIKFSKRFTSTLSLLVTLLFLASCGGDSAPPPEEPTIVGTWKVISAIISDCTESEENGPLEITEATWTFGEDGSFTMADGAFVQTGTYTINGMNLEISGDLIDAIPRTFELDNDALTVIEDTQEDGCIITNMFTREL